jgi:hypothetical protein
MLTVVKYAVPFGSLIVPQLSHIALEIPNTNISKVQNQIFWNNLSTRIERLDKILTKVEESVNISMKNNFQCVEGADLREIQHFLKKT